MLPKAESITVEFKSDSTIKRRKPSILIER